MKNLLEKSMSCLAGSLLLFLIFFSEAKPLAAASPYYLFAWGVINLLLTLFCSLTLRTKIVTGISALFCAIITTLLISWEELFTFVQDFYEWLQAPSVEDVPAAGLYILLMVSFFSVLCFCFQLLAEKLFLLRLLAAASLLVMLFADLFTNRNLQHLTVTAALGYIIIAYILWSQNHWKKHKTNPSRPYLVWMLPFVTCYIILMAVIPAPEKPYDWQFVKSLYKTVNQSLLAITHKLPFGADEDFQISSTGFSEDGRLLGGLVEDYQEVMQVQGQKTQKTNVYLTGKVYDTFHGNGWVQTAATNERERKLDALETMYAVWLYDKDSELNYTRNTVLSINYLDFHTRVLFSPLKTWKVDADELTYSDTDGNLWFENLQGYGTTYHSYYFQINIDHPLFYELLEQPLTPDQEVWKDIQRKYTQAFEDRFSMEDLKQHRQNIQNIYGASYTLSEEVKDYLAQITEDATTDIEKLRAIETALSAYEYTLTPGALPVDITTPEAFLDYFLLESKQGYCSYFATAFVLLARAEGIPARYVEGFCVPIQGEQLVTVYGNMAHAWPEVYIEGVGWIPFEPTPGYAEIRYTPWEEILHQQPIEPEDTWEEEQDLLSTPAPTPSTAEASDTKLTTAPLLKLAGYATLLLISILVLFFIVDKYLQQRRYQKWSTEQKFHAQLQQNLQLLALLGYPRAPMETFEELQKRAWAVMTYEKDGKKYVLEFLTLYEEVLYGKHLVSQEMLEQIQTEREYLQEMLKSYKYWLYLYYKISQRTGGR